MISKCLPEPAFQPPVLVLVAHWDDELLSAGGTLLKYGNKKWDVVSVTQKAQLLEHEIIFTKFCRKAGVNSFTLPICSRVEPYDPTRYSVAEYVRVVPRTKLEREKVVSELRGKGINISKYRTVLTHHSDGDIGLHPQHVELAHIALELFCSFAEVYQFVAPRLSLGSEKCMTPKVQEYFCRQGSYTVHLDSTLLRQKRRCMQKYKVLPRYFTKCLWKEECYLKPTTCM